MFAGKTSFLLNTCGDSENNLVFKPITDKRSPKNKIKSHDGHEYTCIDIQSPVEILQHIKHNTKNICIDELQFFSEGIMEVIQTIVNRGVNVTASGLLLDSNGNYFGSMKKLLAIANRKIELYSQCSNCNKPASHTIRKNKSKDLIHLGGEESYIVSCSNCKSIM